MKLSKTSFDILTNFSAINKSFIFFQGTKQKTGIKGFFAEADFEEEIPLDVGIYELPKFLNVLRIFDNPDIDFKNDYVTISEDKHKVQYRTADMNLIESFVEKNKNQKNIPTDVDFLLTKDILQKAKKGANMFGVENVSFEGDGKNIFVKTFSDSDLNKSFLSMEVGDTDKIFKMVIKLSKLQLILDNDYKVHISKTKAIQMFSQNIKLNYLFGCEAVHSTYQG